MLLPYIDMTFVDAHTLCVYVHACVYGDVFLLCNMVAVVTKFGRICTEFEGKVTTTRNLTQV